MDGLLSFSNQYPMSHYLMSIHDEKKAKSKNPDFISGPTQFPLTIAHEEEMVSMEFQLAC